MIITPQNDIKIEKSGAEDRFNDAEKRKGKCDYCGKTGYTREKCWKFHAVLPKVAVVDVQVLRNLMRI